MKSYVLPLKHPCYAVSDKNGRFKINYLPPGESEFAIWHEKVGWLKTEKFPTGRFKFNVAHTENSIGEVKVDPKIFKKGEPANVVSETPDDQTKFVKEFAKKLEEQLPEGWSVIVSGRFLVVQRDEKTLTLPNFGRRGRSKGETDAEYYADMGAEFTLDVKLRFAPRLSEKDWMELSAHNADLMETSKNGIRSKTELSEIDRLRQKYQLPRYETSDQSIFQSPDLRYYSQIVDRQVNQEYSDVLALLKKSLPANRGMGAVAGKPEFRWPQVWIDTEPTASFHLNQTKAQSLTAKQALERFNGDANSGFLNPQWAQTIDWKDVPDFDAWIKSEPHLAESARKARDPKPTARVVRISKRQVEVKVTRAVGLYNGRSYYGVAKHFRIPRSIEVDQALGLAEIEAPHLTTYKGIGKFSTKADVEKQLGKPDHIRGLQNGDSYNYYFDENVTLFFQNDQVHTVTLNVPFDVIEQVKRDANFNWRGEGDSKQLVIFEATDEMLATIAERHGHC